MNAKELKSILVNHKKWVDNKPGGVPAYLAGAYLYGADLRGAILRGADLSKAYLAGANLSGADLSEAYLAGADLAGAKLSGTKLSGTNLHNANLFLAGLSKANLSGANLSGANLSGANLTKANLSCADLSGVELAGADMEHADIYNATFDEKEEIRKGIVLKKAIKGYKNTEEGVVITAEIPAGAVVFSINGKKCRTSTATIVNMAGHKLLHSQYDHTFTYRLGQKIIIPNFDTRYNVECSTGFHFFRTKKEAMDY